MSGKKRLNNEYIDNLLKNKNIIRISDYISNFEQLKFKCNICNYIWKSQYVNPCIRKTGCPSCNKSVLTNENIDIKLLNRNIKRIEDYKNNSKIKVQCTIEGCNYIWEPYTNNLLTHKYGCAKCSKNAKLSNEEIDRKLLINNIPIKRIGNYYNASTSIDFQCNNCEYKFSTNTDNIINKKSRCPKCSGTVKHTNETIDELLLKRKIKRIENYINNRTKINFSCENCNNIWNATPNNILRLGGCPKCNRFSKSEVLINDILLENNFNFKKEISLPRININESKNYRLDFYLKELNIAIEYNGGQHYIPKIFFGAKNIEEANKKLEKQQQRDEYVKNFCIKNNILLLVINGIEIPIEKLKKYVENTIIPIIKERSI